jgi:DNA-binding response OmpR family regulator
VEPERIEAMLTWRPQAPEARGTILVVSADPAVRDLVGRRLRRAGFATLLTPTGAAALRAIRLERVDLLVLDLPLADMHPIELGTLIKNRDETNSLPIMVLAEPVASADPALNAVTRVADAHVAKPIREDELVARVQTLLDAALTA